VEGCSSSLIIDLLRLHWGAPNYS